MRAIDGDILEKKLKDAINMCMSIDTSGLSELKAVLEDVEEMPTIEPERKKGQWIIKDNPGTGWYRITCSECGEDVTSTAPCIGFYPNAKVMWDFCPNCGAEMREPEDIPMEYFESGGR